MPLEPAWLELPLGVTSPPACSGRTAAWCPSSGPPLPWPVGRPDGLELKRMVDRLPCAVGLEIPEQLFELLAHKAERGAAGCVADRENQRAAPFDEGQSHWLVLTPWSGLIS